jgi:hypothetical protein
MNAVAHQVHVDIGDWRWHALVELPLEVEGGGLGQF